MKVELGSTALAAATGFAARHVPRVPAMPALAGLLLHAEAGGTVTVTGYDIEACSTMSLDAQVIEPGRLLLPGRPIADVLATLPDGPATLTADADSVRIATDTADFTFPTLRLDDFPELPEVPPDLGSVAGETLRRRVGQVAGVAGRDAIPPVLTAIRFELRAGEIRLAATDRYRLALGSLPWDGVEEMVALVPGHLLTAAVGALDIGRDWRLGCDSGHLLLADGERTTVLRLLDASYPPVDRLLPGEAACTLRVDRDALLAAVRRVSLADEQRARGGVVLDVQADGLTVTGGSPPSRGRQRLPAQASGAPLEVAFTANFLIQAVQSLAGETAVLALNPGVGKVLVTGEGVTAEEVESYRHVLMSRQVP